MKQQPVGLFAEPKFLFSSTAETRHRSPQRRKPRFLVPLLFSLLFLVSARPAIATVSVTAATGGGSISADTAGAGFTSLTGPVLTESTKGSIGGGTIIFNAPTGFEWDTTSTSPTVTISGDTTGGTPLAISFTSRTSSAITFTATASGGANGGGIATFGNLRVRPTATTPLASGTISKSGTSTYTTSPSTTNYGSLTEVAAAANAYRLTGTGSPQVGVNYAVTVAYVDQYGNTVSNFSNTKTLTFDASMSAGADGSAALVNGVSQGTAAAVSITSGIGSVILVAHKAESGKALTVTDGTLSSSSTGGATLNLGAMTAGADSAYRLTGTGSLQVGVGYTVNVALVDKYQNPSSFSGAKTLTFNASMSPGADGSAATINGVAQNTATTVNFSSGSQSVTLIAHKAEVNNTLTVTDGTLTSATAGGSTWNLGTMIAGADSAYRLTEAACAMRDKISGLSNPSPSP